MKWLNCTEPTFISSVIAQSHTKLCIFIEIFFDISIIIVFSIKLILKSTKAVSKFDTIMVSKNYRDIDISHTTRM